MKTLNKARWIIGILSMFVMLWAQAYPGENIVLDPATGNYIITYWDDEEPAGLEKTTFVPATKINPTIRSKFRLDGVDSVAYGYVLSNGASAKQAIVGFSLEQIGLVTGERGLPPPSAAATEVENVIFANMSAISSPEDWRGNIYRVRNQSRIAWRPGSLQAGGVHAGRTVAGFGFSSPALPGMSTARMKGLGAVFGYAGEGPPADSAIIAELDRLIKNDFIAHPTAIPSIVVPVPFDAAVLLGRIQAHVQSWVGMQLLDASFAAQLDRYIAASADAYRYNQLKVGKEHIETLRKMLKKEHQDLGRDEEHESDSSQGRDDGRKSALIDRLAARVLDFDLRYVLRRMGEKD